MISKTLYDALLEELAELAQNTIRNQEVSICAADLESPPDQTFGDIALPCFSLAKHLKKNPRAIANDLCAAIQKNLPPLIEKVECKDSYVNFFLSAKTLAQRILANTHADPLKSNAYANENKPVVIEYVSPNTNKPLHLGHLRNAFLGDSIARLREAIGQKVYKTCLINDRGIHICKSMVAYENQDQESKGSGKKKPTPKTENKKGDHFVGDYYVLFEKMAKKNSSWQDAASACLKKWENKDPKTRALWKKMNAWVLKGFAETYKEIGISFDKTYYESALYNQGRDLIKKAVARGIFKKDETGAIIAHLGKFGLPDKVLLRKDGTAIYITQDVFLVYLRSKDFKNAQTLYVVGSEQDMYFKQLFAILSLMQFQGVTDLTHISYGLVNIPEGRMKSREGTTVDADNLIKELKTLAIEILDARDEKLTKKEQEKRACYIALAALKYYILEVSPSSDMVFHPRESISFQGRTGPYILYTYARLKSILRKSGLSKKALRLDVTKGSYSWEAEKKLLITLAQFSGAMRDSVTHSNPSILAQYAYRLAKSSNEYYHEYPILSAPVKEKVARLYLTLAITSTLKKGLGLLGINVLEAM